MKNVIQVKNKKNLRDHFNLFFRTYFAYLSFEIYYIFFIITITSVLICFHNVESDSFYKKLKEITGQDYQNFTINTRTSLIIAQKYHYLCRATGLSRDFSADFGLLKVIHNYPQIDREAALPSCPLYNNFNNNTLSFRTSRVSANLYTF
jgi:hypothetical protein